MLSGIPRTNKLLLIRDFNTNIGRDNDKWPLVMGKNGIGKCNSKGEILLALCSEFELIVTNTMFKLKDEHKTTWQGTRKPTKINTAKLSTIGYMKSFEQEMNSALAK